MGFASEMITTTETAENCGITNRRALAFCVKGLINGALKMGVLWIIPKGMPTTIDSCTKAARAQNTPGDAACMAKRIERYQAADKKGGNAK